MSSSSSPALPVVHSHKPMPALFGPSFQNVTDNLVVVATVWPPSGKWKVAAYFKGASEIGLKLTCNVNLLLHLYFQSLFLRSAELLSKHEITWTEEKTCFLFLFLFFFYLSVITFYFGFISVIVLSETKPNHVRLFNFGRFLNRGIKQ